MVEDIDVLNEHALEAVVNNYDNMSDISGREIAGILGVPEHSDFYDDLMKNDPTVRDTIAHGLEEYAADNFESVDAFAADGGVTEAIESGKNSIYEFVEKINDKHPIGTKIGGGALLTLAAFSGYSILDGGNDPASDIKSTPNDTEYNPEDTTTNSPGTTATTPEDTTDDVNNSNTTDQNTTENTTELEDINKSLSASNITEDDLVNAYLDDNISEKNRDAVYTVFNEELENGTELAEMLTNSNGTVKQKYIRKDINDISENTNTSDILDRDKIFSDIENKSNESTELQDDIADIENWYEEEYEEEVATDIAEKELNASADDVNVTFNQNQSNFTVEGTFYTAGEGQVERTVENISHDEVVGIKENFTTVLSSLDAVRDIEENGFDSSNETNKTDFTNLFFDELDEGNFGTIQDAQSIGLAYENANTSSNVTEEEVVRGFLENETTERELNYLNQRLENNSTNSVNITAQVEDPLNSDWLANETENNAVDNLALMDLGMDPLQDHELLDDYNITRTAVESEGWENDYTIVEIGDGDGFNTSVNSSQLRTFGSTLQGINTEFENPQQIGNVQDLIEGSRQQQMENITDFSFKYIGEDTDAVTDIAHMALNDERFDQQHRTGLAERISFFNTFDQSWSDRSDALAFGKRLVDEDNIRQVREDYNFRDETFREASNNHWVFSGGHDTLDEERLRELKEIMIDGGYEAENFEVDDIDELDYNGGGSDGGNDDDDDDDGVGGGRSGGGGVR